MQVSPALFAPWRRATWKGEKRTEGEHDSFAYSLWTLNRLKWDKKPSLRDRCNAFARSPVTGGKIRYSFFVAVFFHSGGGREGGT